MRRYTRRTVETSERPNKYKKSLNDDEEDIDESFTNLSLLRPACPTFVVRFGGKCVVSGSEFKQHLIIMEYDSFMFGTPVFDDFELL